MSSLNLALQGRALARKKMPDNHEQAIRHCSTLKEIRAKVDNNDALKNDLSQYVGHVTQILVERFNRVRY